MPEGNVALLPQVDALAIVMENEAKEYYRDMDAVVIGRMVVALQELKRVARELDKINSFGEDYDEEGEEEGNSSSEVKIDPVVQDNLSKEDLYTLALLEADMEQEEVSRFRKAVRTVIQNRGGLCPIGEILAEICGEWLHKQQEVERITGRQ